VEGRAAVLAQTIIAILPSPEAAAQVGKETQAAPRLERQTTEEALAAEASPLLAKMALIQLTAQAVMAVQERNGLTEIITLAVGAAVLFQLAAQAALAAAVMVQVLGQVKTERRILAVAVGAAQAMETTAVMEAQA